MVMRLFNITFPLVLYCLIIEFCSLIRKEFNRTTRLWSGRSPQLNPDWHDQIIRATGHAKAVWENFFNTQCGKIKQKPQTSLKIPPNCAINPLLKKPSWVFRHICWSGNWVWVELGIFPQWNNSRGRFGCFCAVEAVQNQHIHKFTFVQHRLCFHNPAPYPCVQIWW